MALGFQNNNEKFTREETIQAVRKDIIGELDAIIQYTHHIMLTDSPEAKKVWTDIRDEERVHVGELFTLLRILEPTETEFFLKGEREVKDLLGI